MLKIEVKSGQKSTFFPVLQHQRETHKDTPVLNLNSRTLRDSTKSLSTLSPAGCDNMEPPRENNSPSTPSRYLNSYLQQNSTELFHQNFPSHRQLPSNQQFYAADNLTTTNNKNYLKRHHQNYHNNEKSGDSERDKKYEKYDNKKLVDDAALHGTYDGFNSDSYASTNLSQSTGSASSGLTSATTTPTAAGKTTATAAGAGAPKSLSNGKKTKGRVKIKMEYIDNKLRRYTTFSKRKTGIMKKVSEIFLNIMCVKMRKCFEMKNDTHRSLHMLTRKWMRENCINFTFTKKSK